jgi:hypothetical protein
MCAGGVRGFRRVRGWVVAMGVNAADGVGVVNGPEDDLWDWHAVDWRAVEEDVRRLRQRIFTASMAGASNGSAICRS